MPNLSAAAPDHLMLFVSEGDSSFFDRIVQSVAPLGVEVKRADRLPIAPATAGEQVIAVVSVNALAQERGWYGLTDVPVIWIGNERHDRQTLDPLGGSRLLPLDFTSQELRSLIRCIMPLPSSGEAPGIAESAGIVTTSECMTELLDEVLAFGGSDKSVLIQGETGVGKELIAELLHQAHPRYSKGPFVPVNCGAVPDGLFESLFFGHAKGAFTGALQSHRGYLEQADGGTLFLDEVGDLPLFQQVKLLRVLESGVITRVGSEAPVQLDFRLVAATNRDLAELVRQEAFRADLYYRIAVIELKVPNLESRGTGDKVALFKAILARTLDAGLPVGASDIPPWLSSQVAATSFPGNVRQLRNLAERVGVIVSQTGRWDEPLIERALEHVQDMGKAPGLEEQVDPQVNERARICRELEKNNWQRQKTADRLGMSRKSLWEKMRRFSIAKTPPEEGKLP